MLRSLLSFFLLQDVKIPSYQNFSSEMNASYVNRGWHILNWNIRILATNGWQFQTKLKNLPVPHYA